jgi:hypothetical protein
MKVRRVVIGILVGTVLSFMWAQVSWVMLKLHDESIRKFPDQDAVAAVLKAQNVERGIFVIPFMDAAYDDEEGMKAHMEDNREGPYMMGVVRSGSLDKVPGMGPFMARGIAIQLLAATIVALLLAAAAPNLNYLGRFMFVAMLGVFAGVTGHLPNWNWWWFPTDHTVISMVDSVISWALAGLAMAAIIKPTADSTGSEASA